MPTDKEKIKALEQELAIYKTFYKEVKEAEDWSEGRELIQSLRDAMKDLRYSLKEHKKRK